MNSWKGSKVHGITIVFVQNTTLLLCNYEHVASMQPHLKSGTLFLRGLLLMITEIDLNEIGPNPFDCGSVEVPECQVHLSRQQLDALTAAHDILAPSNYNGLDIYVQVRQTVFDITQQWLHSHANSYNSTCMTRVAAGEVLNAVQLKLNGCRICQWQVFAW